MQDKYLITLGQTNGLGPATINRLLKTFNSYKNIWTASDDDLKSIQASQELINKINLLRQQHDPDFVVENIQKNGLKVITIYDENYPFLLKQINNPPLIIYTRGNENCLNLQPIISIVGTRRQTTYGQTVLEKLLKDWRDYVKVTVSGLAYGIDSTVHNSSINNQIKTVAVMASSLDWSSFQPSGQRWLAEKIINSGGCLLSDFPINSPVQKYNFPQRNRLIAGLSRITIVIEAGIKSGALITAQHALEYNREVYALPGDISREQSCGCNQLIADGATPLLSWQNVIKTFNLDITNNSLSITGLNKNQQKIINCLRCENNLTIDELVEQTNLGQKQVIIELSKLEIEDLIKRDLFGAIRLN